MSSPLAPALEASGRYRVIEKIGTGGMGEVFLAEDLTLRRRVALKTLRCPDDSAGHARLLREARVASALSHPHIAVVYEVGETEKDGERLTFIAMEYVDGVPLDTYVRRQGASTREVVELVRQVADALAEAHARGVVHRDVKPGNVLVGTGGRVKVLDFGLAAWAPVVGDQADTWSRGVPELAAGAVAGTVAYMSPEQARGEEIDARSDVFSLGVVLHELLSGRPAFGGKSPVETLAAILREEPMPLALPGPEGPELQRILGRMLAKDRERRYQSMRDLSLDLEAVARGETRPPETVPAVAVMAFANITGRGEDDWLGTGIAETVLADLRGVTGLRVIARERIHEVARRLAREGEPEEALPARVGRELGARWAVGGGYQRLGDAVRVTARVVDVEAGTVRHTLKLDGTMAGIFELQDRIVGELSAALRPALPAAAHDAAETQVVEAYEAYAKGVINLRAETQESLDRAILYFERAVAADPRWARAHLQLGSTYDLKAAYLSMPELRLRAERCLRRALELRPELAEAWRELGSTLLAQSRPQEALQAVEQALLLDPADGAAHSAQGRILFIGLARFARAAEAYDRALALNPQGGWYALQLAHCAALLRQFPRGEAAARRAAELQEQFLSGREGAMIVGAHVRLGQLAALQERPQEALAHYERELAFLGRVDHALKGRLMVELHARMGSAARAAGDAPASRRFLEEAAAAFARRLRMGSDDAFTRYYAACAHALLGDAETALAHLEAAARTHPAFTVVRARIEPDLAGLLGEPRFQALAAGVAPPGEDAPA